MPSIFSISNSPIIAIPFSLISFQALAVVSGDLSAQLPYYRDFIAVGEGIQGRSSHTIVGGYSIDSTLAVLLLRRGLSVP